MLLFPLLRSPSPARAVASASRLLLSTQADPKPQQSSDPPRPRRPAAQVSASFVQNIFRGVVETEQIFPYPEVLNEDQLETLSMLVPATEKFLEEVNDPVANDASEEISEDVVKVGREQGLYKCRERYQAIRHISIWAFYFRGWVSWAASASRCQWSSAGWD